VNLSRNIRMGSQEDQHKFHSSTHVIFDLDGLLLDTEKNYEAAITNVLEKYGQEYTLEVQLGVIGRSELEAAEFVIKACNLPVTVEQIIQEVGEEYIKVFKNIEFMPGAKELILHLSKHKIPMAIATSGHLSNFKMKTQNYSDVFKLFSHIVFGSDDEEVEQGKPAPDIFRIAASRFSVPPQNPQNVLVFEDSTVGVVAGLAAGMQVVWVPDHRMDTRIQTTTLLINSLEEFRPELFGLPKFK